MGVVSCAGAGDDESGVAGADSVSRNCTKREARVGWRGKKNRRLVAGSTLEQWLPVAICR